MWIPFGNVKDTGVSSSSTKALSTSKDQILHSVISLTELESFINPILTVESKLGFSKLIVPVTLLPGFITYPFAYP